MKVARLFHPVFPTKNTEKVVKNRTGGDGEDVEHVISKVLQHFHVSFQSKQ